MALVFVSSGARVPVQWRSCSCPVALVFVNSGTCVRKIAFVFVKWMQHVNSDDAESSVNIEKF
jgi:hypothetical protein